MNVIIDGVEYAPIKKPVCYVEGKPVFNGDRLFLSVSHCFVTIGEYGYINEWVNIVPIKENGFSESCYVRHLSWNKPEEKRKFNIQDRVIVGKHGGGKIDRYLNNGFYGVVLDIESCVRAFPESDIRTEEKKQTHGLYDNCSLKNTDTDCFSGRGALSSGCDWVKVCPHAHKAKEPAYRHCQRRLTIKNTCFEECQYSKGCSRWDEFLKLKAKEKETPQEYLAQLVVKALREYADRLESDCKLLVSYRSDKTIYPIDEIKIEAELSDGKGGKLGIFIKK